MLALLFLPVSAHAEGSGAGGTAAPAPLSAPSPDGAPTPTNGDMPVDMPTIAYVRDPVQLKGRARRARQKIVSVELRAVGGTWVQVARVRASKTGSWSVVWKPRKTGSYELRARLGAARPGGDGSAGGTSAGGGIPAGVGDAGGRFVMVYKSAIATWYGPGFFGNKTACGIELTPETIGVAHRKLPCGTQVQLAYGGRTIVVPVIDRGPYANDADWDLTQAAAELLGMAGTSQIGAMPLASDR